MVISRTRRRGGRTVCWSRRRKTALVTLCAKAAPDRGEFTEERRRAVRACARAVTSRVASAHAPARAPAPAPLAAADKSLFRKPAPDHYAHDGTPKLYLHEEGVAKRRIYDYECGIFSCPQGLPRRRGLFLQEKRSGGVLPRRISPRWCQNDPCPAEL